MLDEHSSSLCVSLFDDSSDTMFPLDIYVEPIWVGYILTTNFHRNAQCSELVCGTASPVTYSYTRDIRSNVTCPITHSQIV